MKVSVFYFGRGNKGFGALRGGMFSPRYGGRVWTIGPIRIVVRRRSAIRR